MVIDIFFLVVVIMYNRHPEIESKEDVNFESHSPLEPAGSPGRDAYRRRLLFRSLNSIDISLQAVFWQKGTVMLYSLVHSRRVVYIERVISTT